MPKNRRKDPQDGLYKAQCQYCNKEFKSMYDKQLDNNIGFHEQYCPKKWLHQGKKTELDQPQTNKA